MAFRMDAERVHEIALQLIKSRLVAARLYRSETLSQTLMGRTFANPLGLAAGFDKNAILLDRWARFSFGFVECGTITRFAQPGNERPRLFRVPKQRAIINRMGFNNDGAEAIGRRIASACSPLPLGINIGKSRGVDIQDASEDYRSSFEVLHTLGDYFVINVSSPNTPNLRGLQEKSRLEDIIVAMLSVDRARPLFVKISPDLSFAEVDDVVAIAASHGLAGIVATNTTTDHNSLGLREPIFGGMSGAPLKNRSNELLKHLYNVCEKSLLLIGVGGVFDGDDLYQKIALGAHLCQTYTGWIYEGPNMAARALQRLDSRMKQAGVESVSKLRGSMAA